MRVTNNILVVDDQPDIRELLKIVLDDQGYHVDAVRNGYEAIEKVNHQHFDLICLDVKMPGLNGAETLEEIRKVQPKIPVIMITGYGENDILSRARNELGAYDCIFKPFDMSELIAGVERGLNNHAEKIIH